MTVIMFEAGHTRRRIARRCTAMSKNGPETSASIKRPIGYGVVLFSLSCGGLLLLDHSSSRPGTICSKKFWIAPKRKWVVMVRLATLSIAQGAPTGQRLLRIENDGQ